MTENEKNIKAIVNAGEVEYYSSTYFKEQGKLGRKAKLKKYGKKGMSAISRKAWITKKSKKK